MTREDAFKEINTIQDKYIDELVSLIHNPNYEQMKIVNFSSPTGTGKTKMMSKLINKFPNCYFIITTLSKGQLHIQIRNNLLKDCHQQNFKVYGSADYKINSRLQADDIIGNIPVGTKCIWLRDEGHIRTNKFEELLIDKCYKVINFSATNLHSDIQCNFTQTMMLRTVNQTVGTPEDAIYKLLDIKIAHRDVPHYNPCAIFRCVSGNSEIYDRIVSLCHKNHLKYIDITTESFDMSELCEDDNEYDVIINKFKIVEGIDIRRAHVLYMDNQPNNNATTIQIIGRCRRNALLYRNDIDIFSQENTTLLKHTRECYVYYNVETMNIDTDGDGELQFAFCNYISCEMLRSGSIIEVENGRLPNGLFVTELGTSSGIFEVVKDIDTGFNKIIPVTSFYDEIIDTHSDYVYFKYEDTFKKCEISKISKYPLKNFEYKFSWAVGYETSIPCEPYFDISESPIREIFISENSDVIHDFMDLSNEFISNLDSDTEHLICIENISSESNEFVNTFGVSVDDTYYFIEKLETYREKNDCDFEVQRFFQFLTDLNNYMFEYDGVEHRLCQIFEYDEISLLKYLCLDMFQRQQDISEIDAMLNYIALTLYEAFLYDEDYCIYDIKQIIGFMYFEYLSGNNDVYTYDSLYKYLSFWAEADIANSNQLEVNSIDVYDYFCNLLTLTEHRILIFNKRVLISVLEKCFTSIVSDLKNGFVNVKTASYLEDVTEDEAYALRNGYLKYRTMITKKEYDNMPKYQGYTKIYNDSESAIIGTDLMQQFRTDSGKTIWLENRAVSSKVCSYNKLNAFISAKYENELIAAKQQYFNGKNNFKLNKKCNSCIGYCVEYYSKWLIYGDEYLALFIEKAQEESGVSIINNFIIIRACMLKYKAMMIRSFGRFVAKVIKGIPVQTLIKNEYKYFVDLVVELGTRTANYVRLMLYPDGKINNSIDANLSIAHITGLADYITEDTILDVKVRNNIDEKCVRQVLAYHYLSTKRSDLHIKRVIVYDAVSDKAVVINITPDNLKGGESHENISK